MTESQSEAPTVLVCNGKIDFEGGAPTSPVANGIIYSESPKFLATKNSPSAYAIQKTKPNHRNTMVEDSEVSVCARHEITAKDNNAALEEVHSPRNVEQGGLNRGLIETRAPIESVKAAVSKFGGVVAWKAHRSLTMERNKPMEEELVEVQEEIFQCGKRSEAAAESESQVLKELENTKQHIEELNLALEGAQTEERQVKHDLELARLRPMEMEQGIAEENDVVAKTQFEAAVASHTAAVSELKSIKEELETLHKEFASLVSERDFAVKNADEAVAASKEAKKALEEMTIELVAIKKSLESAQAAHIEAEEQRIGAALTQEQEYFNWKEELDVAEEEFCRLNLQILSIEDLKSNVNIASVLLSDLKAEMTAYMESILKKEVSDEWHMKGEVAEAEKRTCTTIQSVVDSTKRELEEVKLNIEKAVAEVECLKMAAASLKSELEGEKSTTATTSQREGTPSIVAASLEAELEKYMSEIVVVQGNINEAQENRVELTNQLKQAAQEADQAKSLAQVAREELRKAKIEAEQAEAERSAMESRLLAAHKEIEAADASKMLALAATKALQESDSAGVTLSLEEYNELSRCAYQAEEQAEIRVTDAISQMEAMKESEAKTLEMLEEVSQELVTRQEALKAATEKAAEAEEGKLAVEQELRTLRAELEQQRKGNESGQEALISKASPRKSSEILEPTNSDHAVVPAPQVPSPEEQMQKSDSRADSLSDSKDGKKKKKSFFPKMLTLLGKQKASRNKST